MRHFPVGAEGQSYWYHADGRGSVAGVTKQQGQSTHNYRYDAYGQVLPARGNWTDPHNHYTFSGKEWDEHLGLYEFGYRLYDPRAGIWLTQDPLRGQPRQPLTLHRYTYAFASPISYYDRYGLQGEPPPQQPPPQPAPQPYTTYLPVVTQNYAPPSTAYLPYVARNARPTGTQCSPELPWWSDRLWWSSATSKAALGFDVLAFVLSGTEALITDVVGVVLVGGFATLGASQGGAGAVPGALAGLALAIQFDVAIAGGSVLAGYENALGGLSLLATGASDVFAGYTGLTESGVAIGQDTLIAARNALAGLIPESNLDFLISASQLKYDVDRNFGGKEGGSIEFSGLGDVGAWGELLNLVFLQHWR